MQRWMGLDINGWHDWAARDWDAEDPDEPLPQPAQVDGGTGSVAILNSGGRWIGGPQAQLAPHGRGPGWGDIGDPQRRGGVMALWNDLIAGDRAPGPDLAAAVDALSRGAQRIMLATPDHPGFAEAAQGRVLRALKGRGRPHVLLLWRSVALFLHALEAGAIPRDHLGLRVRLLIHTAQGIEIQTLRLAEADGFPGHLAPERDGFGKLAHPDLGLSAWLDYAANLVKLRNPVLSAGRIEPSRLPVRMLCDAVQAGEVEILRRNNGTWAEVFAPEFESPMPAPAAMAERVSGESDLTFLATPLARAPRTALLATLEGHYPSLQPLPWDGIALGALHAGRLVEKGLPHYLERLEPIALAVLGRDDARFEPLIPGNRNVPANREFISEPMTDFVWDAGKDRVEFYVLKGATEVRTWVVSKAPGPVTRVPVTLQLRQMPGQSWAKLSVTSPEWEPLARAPIHLDWDALEPDPRSPEEILKSLERPRPIVPNRVVEPPHIGLWDGSLVEPGLSALIGRDADELYEGVRRSWREFVEDSPGRGHRQIFHPVGTDGTFPEELSDADRDGLLAALSGFEKQLSANLAGRRPPASNRPFLCLTWCFTLCPEAIQSAILDALEAWNAGRSHPLHAMTMAQTILQQGAGRAIDGADRVAHLLRILTARPSPNMHTRAALSFVLSRRGTAPAALSDDLVRVIARNLLSHLRELLAASSFERDFKYLLMALTGLLRYREVSPWALVVDRESLARDLAAELAKARRRLLQRVHSVRQGHEKRAIVDELIAMLRGTGGDPDLLRRIDDLGE
jgi:hypothetical protein